MSAEEFHRHKPREIKPQGEGSGFNADMVDGVEAADVVKSVPPDQAKKKVTNIYIEFVDGNPKLRVEYEDE